MGKLVVSEVVTLDFVMEDPDRYASEYATEATTKAAWAALMAADSLLLGRLTYEGFARTWPTRKGTATYGERMNQIRKYVVSATLSKAERNNTTVLGKNALEEIARLKQKPGGDLLVLGSGQLVNTLLKHGLIDEFRLTVFPVIAGDGKRLFKNQHGLTKLRVVESKSTSTGVLLLTCTPPPGNRSPGS